MYEYAALGGSEKLQLEEATQSAIALLVEKQFLRSLASRRRFLLQSGVKIMPNYTSIMPIHWHYVYEYLLALIS